MGGGAPAAALVEGDDAVQVGVEEAPAQGIATSARAAVDEHHRQTLRRTALVHIEHVRRLYRQFMAGVGFDLRIQSLHGALLDVYVGYGANSCANGPLALPAVPRIITM
ncbi:hypothetical protein D3C86_1879050 [compost metagenome]